VAFGVGLGSAAAAVGAAGVAVGASAETVGASAETVVGRGVGTIVGRGVGTSVGGTDVGGDTASVGVPNSPAVSTLAIVAAVAGGV